MVLADIDAQILLVHSIGDVDPETGDPVLPTSLDSTGIVMQNIGRLWLKYAEKAAISTDVRDLYVQRAGLDLVIAVLESKVDFTIGNGGNDGFTIKLSQRIAARQKQRAALQDEIKQMEVVTVRSGTPVLGPITQTEPITPPAPGDVSSPYPYGPDGNDPRYGGSPYWRSRGNATR